MRIACLARGGQCMCHTPQRASCNYRSSDATQPLVCDCAFTVLCRTMQLEPFGRSSDPRTAGAHPKLNCASIFSSYRYIAELAAHTIGST
eukprot:6200044-Pleurochrysis_carterae.AAC.1